MTNSLATEPTLFRTGIAKSSNHELSVDRTGGMFDAGVIRNFAVMTLGDALGHKQFIDETFMLSVAEQLARADKGIKSRFTHPGMSGDALSRGLGRVVFRKHEGNKIFGDLHFHKASHKGPDGDLAEFVMTLTGEDAEALGASISFNEDKEAMEAFAELHEHSPDPRNTNNFPHVRLGKLRFVDIVDEPAANPDGMFHKDQVFADADALMEYVLGLSDHKPAESIFGVDAERMHGFCTRFLLTRNLGIMKNLIKMPEDATPTEPAIVELSTETAIIEPSVEPAIVEPVEPVEPVELSTEPAIVEPVSTQSTLSQYVAMFGKERACDYVLKDFSLADAQADHIQWQDTQIEALKMKVDVAEASDNGPLSGNSGDTEMSAKGKGLGAKLNLPE